MGQGGRRRRPRGGAWELRWPGHQGLAWASPAKLGAARCAVRGVEGGEAKGRSARLSCRQPSRASRAIMTSVRIAIIPGNAGYMNGVRGARRMSGSPRGPNLVYLYL